MRSVRARDHRAIHGGRNHRRELISVHRDTDYFVLGDGALACIVEWNHRADREPYGLLIARPGRISRRESSLLWHPEHRLRRTMLTATVDGVRFTALPETTIVQWIENGEVSVRWSAGDVGIDERLSSAGGILTRSVFAKASRRRSVQFEFALYGNPTLFDGFETLPCELRAYGYEDFRLTARGTCSAFERFLVSGPVVIEAGDQWIRCTSVEYQAGSIDTSRERTDERRNDSTASRQGAVSAIETELRANPLQILFEHSRRGLRAAVSHDGRFNASLLQYEFEWGMDAAMVAAAAVIAGDVELASQVLRNILTRLSSSDGMIAEAGRFRGGALSELNGNGAVLEAVSKYWRYTRDDEFIRAHWERIVAIALYPLRDEFQHESGLLRTRRDFWERYPWQGVGDGFELGHQVFCCVGLASAAELAEVIGDAEHALQWQGASLRIHRAMIEHPTHSLIEAGRFIRRRLIDGTHEISLVQDPTWRQDQYAPYMPTGYDDRRRSCEPDVTEVLPIIYGLVDANSSVARATLDAVAMLWSPNGSGGYARYNIDSDPDSPGPWPFASAMVAAAEIEAEYHERAGQTIGWLISAAGPGGSWLEYYGERESPPFPPIGIIVWGWAQFILLTVTHLAGVRVERHYMQIRPRATGFNLSFPIGGHHVTIAINGFTAATVNGTDVVVDDGAIRIALPLATDHFIAFN